MTALPTEPIATPKTSAKSDAVVRCAHCALPVPPGLIEPNAQHQFCCHGCKSVFHILQQSNLTQYYALRDNLPYTEPAQAQTTDQSYADFDHETFLETHTQTLSDNLQSIDLLLPAVHCAACVWLVEKLPRVAPGVVDCRLNLPNRRARVLYDPNQTPLSRVARSLDQLGYPPHPARASDRDAIDRQAARQRLVRIGVAGACAGNVMLLAFALYAGDLGDMQNQFTQYFRWLSLAIASLCLAWPGATFFRGALAALRTRTPNLDLPIALALAAGWAAGSLNTLLQRGDIYFDSLCTLVFLLLVGRYIQFKQQRRAQDAVDLTAALTPHAAHKLIGNDFIDTPLAALHPGDTIAVHPGETFPADATVQTGQSTANLALLTGEHQPAPLNPGDHAYAGTVNLTGRLTLTVQHTADRSRLGKLLALVEQGIADKPPIVRFTDRVAGVFVTVLSLLALAVFAAWSFIQPAVAVDHTVALLIVACPCALGLATPLTLAVATARAAQRGILIKSAAALEHLARPGHLLLDKTGTVTLGQPAVADWQGDPSLQPLAAALEQHANHPLAQAITHAYATDDLPSVQHFTQTPTGVQGQLDNQTLHLGPIEAFDNIDPTLTQHLPAWRDAGHTCLAFAINQQVRATLAVGDTLRPDAPAALQHLRAQGWQPALLSGDAAPAVQHVAEQLDLADAIATATPETKLEHVKHLQAEQVQTVMVGDGINDAAALAAAHVGIAVHGGAEASLAAADVYLARPGLSPLIELTDLSRKTLRVIRANLAVSLTYNALGVTLAALGYITPLAAAVLMPLSSVTVLTLAAARLQQWIPPQTEATP